MEKLIIFILATSGLSWIITRSKLFKPMREYFTTKRDSASFRVSYYVFLFLNSITNCEACFGFWSGILNSIIIYKYINELTVAYGFAGAMISMLVIALHKFLSK